MVYFKITKNPNFLFEGTELITYLVIIKHQLTP